MGSLEGATWQATGAPWAQWAALRALLGSLVQSGGAYPPGTPGEYPGPLELCLLVGAALAGVLALGYTLSLALSLCLSLLHPLGIPLPLSLSAKGKAEGRAKGGAAPVHWTIRVASWAGSWAPKLGWATGAADGNGVGAPTAQAYPCNPPSSMPTLESLLTWHQLPAGPWSWPVLGVLPRLWACQEPHRELAELSLTYGPVFGMRVGCRPAVVVSSAEAAKDVLRGAADLACSSRPPLLTWHLLSLGGQDIALAPRGPRHTLARRLATMHLFTAKRMDAWAGVRHQEVSALIEAVAEEAAAAAALEGGLGAVAIRPHIARTSLNNILRMVCGRRYSFNRPGRPDGIADEVTAVIYKVAGLLGPFNYVDHIPGWQTVEKHVLKDGASVRCAQLAPRLNAFFDALLQEHRKRRKKAAAAAAAAATKAASAAAAQVPTDAKPKYPNVDNAASYTPKEEPGSHPRHRGQKSASKRNGNSGASGQLQNGQRSAAQEEEDEAERDFTDVLLTLQETEEAEDEEEGGEMVGQGEEEEAGESGGGRVGRASEGRGGRGGGGEGPGVSRHKSQDNFAVTGRRLRAAAGAKAAGGGGEGPGVSRHESQDTGVVTGRRIRAAAGAAKSGGGPGVEPSGSSSAGRRDALSDEEIMSLLQDMVVAGTETSAGTVEWALAELIRCPRAQQRLHQELDAAARKARQPLRTHTEAQPQGDPQASHKGTHKGTPGVEGQIEAGSGQQRVPRGENTGASEQGKGAREGGKEGGEGEKEGEGGERLIEEEWGVMDLPYLQAVVKETLRLHPPGTLLMPHFALEPCSILNGKHTIPAGTMVLVNAWAIARDPRTWERPNEFLPERFLEDRDSDSIDNDSTVSSSNSTDNDSTDNSSDETWKLESRSNSIDSTISSNSTKGNGENGASGISRSMSVGESGSRSMGKSGSGRKDLGSRNVDMRGSDARLLPFGSGRRSCVGARLGHTLVSLMLARLVQAFHWAPAGNEAEARDMSVLYGLASRKRVALKARVTPRYSDSPAPSMG